MITLQELVAMPKKKKTKFELAAETNATDTSSTTTGTDLGTDMRLTQFTEEITKQGQDFRFLQQVVNINTQLIGTRDFGVRLFFENTVLNVTQTHTQTDVRTFTELTNLGFVDAAVVFKMGAIAISKEIASTSHIDLVDFARYAIVQATEKDIEDDIITELTTATANAVFGGDATSAATLETGDVLNADVIIDARTKLREDNQKPAILIIHPIQEGQILKDSQFTNAAEYGGREVVLNGEIGKFAGTKVMVTTNIAAGSGFGATGHLCFMLGKNAQGQWPATLVWKEKPNYSMEFLKRRNTHYIYADVASDVELVIDNGVVEINVTDA